MGALHAKAALAGAHGTGLGAVAASASGALPEYLMGIASMGGLALILFATLTYLFASK